MADHFTIELSVDPGLCIIAFAEFSEFSEIIDSASGKTR